MENRTLGSKKEIPQRELRNDVGRILMEVAEGGVTYRITVSGRPAADLVPIERRRRFAPRALAEEIIRKHPLDQDFLRDVDTAAGGTIDEIFE